MLKLTAHNIIIILRGDIILLKLIEKILLDLSAIITSFYK